VCICIPKGSCLHVLLGCTLFVFIRFYLLASNVNDYYPTGRRKSRPSCPSPGSAICYQDSGSTCRLLCQLSLISKCSPVRTKVVAPFWMILLVLSSIQLPERVLAMLKCHPRPYKLLLPVRSITRTPRTPGPGVLKVSPNFTICIYAFTPW